MLFLLPSSSKKFSAQKRSSSQVLKPFLWLGHTLPPLLHGNALEVTVKYELSIYVTRTAVFFLQNNFTK